MKSNLSKIFRPFFVLSLLTLIGLSSSALSDTTKLADNTINNAVTLSEITTAAIANNVVYPKTLQNHREQTLDYVENFSKKRRDYLIHLYNTGKKYFPKVVSILK